MPTASRLVDRGLLQRRVNEPSLAPQELQIGRKLYWRVANAAVAPPTVAHACRGMCKIYKSLPHGKGIAHFRPAH
jgi:hypothetical protein